jgi:hypothetical protein
MLKVGIFGDSYADPIRHGHDNFRELDAIGWPNLLKNNYEVGLHALAGSSIYYSYQEFLKHHEKYDKIVFVVTDPIRWIKGYKLSKDEDRIIHLSSYAGVENWLESNPDMKLEDRCIVEALKGYYLFLVDDPSCQVIANLMLNHMRQLRPDIIFIPIARNLLNIDTVGFDNYLDLFHIEMGVGTSFEHGKFLQKKYEYRLACHLSKEMNIVVANDVTNALEIGKWNPTDPKPIRHEHKSDYYWRPISELNR